MKPGAGSKTFFPLPLLTTDMRGSHTPWPDMAVYQPHRIGPDERSEFEEFYRTERAKYNGVFDWDLILEQYCVQDCRVLLAAVNSLSAILGDEFGIRIKCPYGTKR